MSSVLVLLLVLAGCSNDKSPEEAPGDITVFAATSLTGAFTEIGKTFEVANPGTKVTFNFGASSALVQQLKERAPADVFAAADEKTIGTAFEAHLVGTPSPAFARNRLVIVTKPGNPAKVSSLADLATAGTVSLCAADVPCGGYAAQALRKAHVTIDESSVSRAPNVGAALTAVSDGDAVAAIVYASDAKSAATRVTMIPIPESSNVVAEYFLARVKTSSHLAAARVFIAFVRGSDGQRILRDHGFLTT